MAAIVTIKYFSSVTVRCIAQRITADRLITQTEDHHIQIGQRGIGQGCSAGLLVGHAVQGILGTLGDVTGDVADAGQASRETAGVRHRNADGYPADIDIAGADYLGRRDGHIARRSDAGITGVYDSDRRKQIHITRITL